MATIEEADDDDVPLKSGVMGTRRWCSHLEASNDKNDFFPF